jgi:hypothetical protein
VNCLLHDWELYLPLQSPNFYSDAVFYVNFSFSLNSRAVIAQSVQRWATGWMIGVLGFDSRRGLGIFLFTTASRTALEPTQPPIQWVLGALSLEAKRPGREADRSPPFSAEDKEWVELYIHPPNTPSWRGAQLKHRDNFTFTVYPLTLGSLHAQSSSIIAVWVTESHHCEVLPWKLHELTPRFKWYWQNVGNSFLVGM